MSLGVWQHVALSWDGSASAANVRIYVNGQEVTYQTTTNGVNLNADADRDLVIGNRADGARTFDGTLDELRISNTVRTCHEIATDHQNQSDPGAVGSPGFYTLGPEERVP